MTDQNFHFEVTLEGKNICVATISDSGKQGKTSVQRHALVPNLPGARLIAVESLNHSMSTAEKVSGSDFEVIAFDLMFRETPALIDIGASNKERFMDLVNETNGAIIEQINVFVMPVKSNIQFQGEGADCIDSLLEVGVKPEQILVLPNEVDPLRMEPEKFEKDFELILTKANTEGIRVLDPIPFTKAIKNLDAPAFDGFTVNKLAAKTTKEIAGLKLPKDDLMKLVEATSRAPKVNELMKKIACEIFTVAAANYDAAQAA